MTIFININFINNMLNKNMHEINKIIKSKNYNKTTLNIIINLEKKKNNRKSIIRMIEAKIKSIDNKGTKSGNGTDETIRINWIVNQINNNTFTGVKMKLEYFHKFNKSISKLEVKGSKQDHYDILIFNTDNTKYKCEEKGTKSYYKNINSSTNPYENSVEFYNGPAQKFSISRNYLQLWYNNNVNNQETKLLYNLPDIPNFDDWLNGGPYCMVDPTSYYSKSLKLNYRNKSSMNGYKQNNVIDYRIKPNLEFCLNDEQKKILITEVQQIYNNVLNEKDIWLQTSGIPNGNFSYCWYNKIEPKTIINIELIKKKDIQFKFILEDNSYFMGIMRWGKGCGFSCFRMDFK
jgi:hypothetical protein